MAYRDGDSILDQNYTKQICSAFYYEDLKFQEWFKKMHIWRNTALNNKELIKYWFSAIPMLEGIFVWGYEY